YRGSLVGDLAGPNSTALTETEKFVAAFSSFGALVQHQNLIPRQTIALLRSTCERPESYSATRIESVGRGSDQSNLFTPTACAGLVHRDTMRLCELACSLTGKSRILNERSQPLVRQNNKGIHGQLGLFDMLHSVLWRVALGIPRALDEQGFQYAVTPRHTTPEIHNRLGGLVEAGEYVYDESGGVTIGDRRFNTASFADIDVAPWPESMYTTKLFAKRKSEGHFINPSGFVLSKTPVPIMSIHADGLLKLLKFSQAGRYSLEESSREVLISGICRDNSDQALTLMTQNHALNAMAPIFMGLERVSGFSMNSQLRYHISASAHRIKSVIRNNGEPREAFLCQVAQNEMVQVLISDSDGQQAEWPARLKPRFIDNQNGTCAIASAFDLQDTEGRSLLIRKTNSSLSSPLPSVDVEIDAALVELKHCSGRTLAALIATAVLALEQYIVHNVLSNAVKGDRSAGDTLVMALGLAASEKVVKK
ncbi:hypothetical protein B0A48_18647, partial [Cryoendolithus antarcticus]